MELEINITTLSKGFLGLNPGIKNTSDNDMHIYIPECSKKNKGSEENEETGKQPKGKQEGKQGRGNQESFGKAGCGIRFDTGRGRETSGSIPVRVNAGTFYKAIKAAKENNPYGAYVALYEKEDYARKQLFLMGNGAAGIAVSEDGDIVSVFKHPGKAEDQRLKNVSEQLLKTALEHGGNKLDCFAGFLPGLYMSFGFIPVCRVKFDREYAPECWNYERDGEPDVIFFVHNGDAIEEIDQNRLSYGTYNPDSVPYASNYDDGIAMRDSVLEMENAV